RHPSACAPGDRHTDAATAALSRGATTATTDDGTPAADQRAAALEPDTAVSNDPRSAVGAAAWRPTGTGGTVTFRIPLGSPP
ncbi:MAG TPA: hypothetical protein VF477_03240, partial [Mycobacterium sp.]